LTQGRARGLLLLFALAALLCVPASASAINTVSFSPAGNMAVGRDGPGAALLPDGRVLVVGGYHNPGGVYEASTEIYNPSTNSFGAGPPTPTELYAPAVASLPDGRVLIAGGYDGSNVVARADVFNPSTGTYSPVGPLLHPRENTAAAPLADGRILVVGGYDNSGNSVNTTEIFDPKTNTFSLGPTLPTRRYGAAVASISGGRVLVAGGYDSNTSAYFDSAFSLDSGATAFSPVGSLPAHSYAPAGASLPQGRALVAGGYDSPSGDYVTRALIFDPTTNSFSSAGIGNLSHAAEEAAAVELRDGRVLVVGGWNGEALNTAEVLSVPTNSFKSKLKGQKVTFSITNEGVAQTTDVSTKVATSAKKKKAPKLVKTTSKHGGPGKITVKIKLTKQGNAKLREKGKLKVRVVYTPDQGLSATKKLKLSAGN
jgi:large repetitive protein